MMRFENNRPGNVHTTFGWITAEQINEFIEWLEESWYTDSEMQKSISEDELFEFIESVAELAKQQAD